MALQNFVDETTVIYASWLNAIDVIKFTIFDDAATKADARTALGVYSSAQADAVFAPIAKGVTNGNSHDHLGGDGGTIAYSSLSGTPTLGTASAADLIDDDSMAAATAANVPSSESVVAYVTAQVIGAGAGDVVGPTSAVDSNFAAFDSTTGKLIKDSGAASSTFATAAQGALADTALQSADVGTAAALDVGTAIGDIPQLEDVGGGTPGLPAVDGSQLTNLPGGGGGVTRFTGTVAIPSTVPAGGEAAFTITVTGAALGDAVDVLLPDAYATDTDLWIIAAKVSATDTVIGRIGNTAVGDATSLVGNLLAIVRDYT